MFNWIANVIARLGYTGVIGLTFLENLFPPIPSELVIPMAGFVAASEGEMRLGFVIVAGSIGSLAGATFWYAIARKVGEKRLRAWVERHGKWVTLGRKDVDHAQAWFQRHGKSAVLLGRLMPGVRTFVSVPAGFTEMAVAPFLLYSALGTVIWTAALAGAGTLLQANFTVVGDYINVATNILLGLFLVMLVRRYVMCWRATD
jgi:membrane protein DedA with SNARE-associated domain